MKIDAATTQRGNNREKQRKFRDGLQNKGLRRISLIVKEDTYSKIKEIAAFSGITQGEVLNKMLEIKGRM